MSTSEMFDEHGDININPSREDGETEGFSGIQTERGQAPRKVHDNIMFDKNTSITSLDDSADDDEQPLP